MKNAINNAQVPTKAAAAALCVLLASEPGAGAGSPPEEVPFEEDEELGWSTLESRVNSVQNGSHKKTYLSMTCTTPFATSTSAIVTVAWFTFTDPLDNVICTVAPLRVGIIWPFVSVVLYPTVPFTTWYSRMLAS